MVGSALRFAVTGLVLVGASCRASEFRARLTSGDEVLFVRAIKGNDLVVRKGDELARVRLVGVYAFDPAVNENRDIAACAKGAAEAVTTELAGRPLRVELIHPERDPRGRHLAYLTSDTTDVGRWLLAEGHVAVYTEYPFARESDYLAVEAQSRARVQGVWAAPVAAKRIDAFRQTWAAVRSRAHGGSAVDPLLDAGTH